MFLQSSLVSFLIGNSWILLSASACNVLLLVILVRSCWRVFLGWQKFISGRSLLHYAPKHSLPQFLPDFTFSFYVLMSLGKVSWLGWLRAWGWSVYSSGCHSFSSCKTWMAPLWLLGKEDSADHGGRGRTETIQLVHPGCLPPSAPEDAAGRWKIWIEGQLREQLLTLGVDVLGAVSLGWGLNTWSH